MATANPKRRILSQTLDITVPSHPTIDTFAVLEVIWSWTGPDEGPRRLLKSGLLRKVAFCGHTTARSLIARRLAETKKGIPVGDELSVCAEELEAQPTAPFESLECADRLKGTLGSGGLPELHLVGVGLLREEISRIVGRLEGETRDGSSWLSWATLGGIARWAHRWPQNETCVLLIPAVGGGGDHHGGIEVPHVSQLIIFIRNEGDEVLPARRVVLLHQSVDILRVAAQCLAEITLLTLAGDLIHQRLFGQLLPQRWLRFGATG